MILVSRGRGWEAQEGWGSTNPPEPESPLWDPHTECPTPHSPGAAQVRREGGCKGNGCLAYLVNELPDIIWIVTSISFLSRFSVISFIYLVPSNLPHFRNNWGKVRSDLSSAPLIVHPGNNLLLTVLGLFLASKQLSKSTEALRGWACPHSNSHLTVRGGGGMRRKPVNLFQALDHSFVSAEIREGLKVEAPQSQMQPPALLFILPLKQFGRQGCGPYFFLEQLGIGLNQTRQEQEVWSKQAAYAAAHWRHWMKGAVHVQCRSLKRADCSLTEHRVGCTNRSTCIISPRGEWVGEGLFWSCGKNDFVIILASVYYALLYTRSTERKNDQSPGRSLPSKCPLSR